ncbi:MAG: replication factor C large subunit [Candidatus Lokiarchaeota archaeon]|nr:replication factor C large subunit [Candidatus Lokiarchaeota archaeon]
MAKKKIYDIPWVEKYRPKSIKDMAIPTAKLNRHKVSLVEELPKFINNFFNQKEMINKKNQEIRTFNRNCLEKEKKKKIELPQEKAAILLEGQPGIGKTSIVYALANDLNMEVIETNASDTRTRDALESKLKETAKSKGIMDFISETKKKIILIDEVDGIYGTKDRGAVPTIIDLSKNTQFPIILCANEYKLNLQSLYNSIPRYEVNPLSKDEVYKIINRILKKENVENIIQEDLELIINKNEGDLRGILNDLQALSQISNESPDERKKIIMSLHRDTTKEIFSIVRDLFQSVNTLNEARTLTNKSDVDYNFLYKWINENLPTFIQNKEDLSTAFEYLSIADEIFGRIKKNMQWSLLPYFYDLFAGGVALTRKGNISKGYRTVNFPRYSTSSSFSLNTAEKSLIEKIQEKYPISQSEIFRDFLPFLKIITESSRRNLKNLSDWLDLNAKEKNLLKKTQTSKK